VFIAIVLIIDGVVVLPIMSAIILLLFIALEHVLDFILWAFSLPKTNFKHAQRLTEPFRIRNPDNGNIVIGLEALLVF